jgi:hypothetical protein
MNNLDIKQIKVNRIYDILEQVEQLNKMIHLHQQNENSSMLEQYKMMKQDFIEELNAILVEFEIRINAA